MISISSLVLGTPLKSETLIKLSEKKEFYESGKLKNHVVKIGSEYKFIRYFESGCVEEVGFYNSFGQKNGEWNRFFEDGKISATANFKNGEKNGDWKIYNSDGNMTFFIKYKKGKRVEGFMWTENKGLVYQ